MFWIVESLIHENTYFIFREVDQRNCTEIKVTIRNNMMLPDKNLKPEEAEYIRENIIEKGETIIR